MIKYEIRHLNSRQIGEQHFVSLAIQDMQIKTVFRLSHHSGWIKAPFHEMKPMLDIAGVSKNLSLDRHGSRENQMLFFWQRNILLL